MVVSSVFFSKSKKDSHKKLHFFSKLNKHKRLKFPPPFFFFFFFFFFLPLSSLNFWEQKALIQKGVGLESTSCEKKKKKKKKKSEKYWM